MGLKLTMTNGSTKIPLEITDYQINEAAMPLAAGDSSGSVGRITFSMPKPDPYVSPADSPLVKYGSWWMVGKEIEITDTRRGYTVGRITKIEETYDGWQINVTADTRLGSLNIYNIQAKPYVGTLQGAFNYYLGLAGVTTGTFIDDSLAMRPVAYPGFSGELWYRLKQMATAQAADISLVSGLIFLRPVRDHEAPLSHATNITRAGGEQSLAQSIDIYLYNNYSISSELVWPGPDPGIESQVFTVQAGEVTEFALEFSASLTTLAQPTAQDWVSPAEESASVYSVLSNGNDRVPAALWTKYGGKVQVILNPDTVTARLIITGPRGLRIGGEFPTSFTLADFADGDNSSRRSTLRIVGSGVAYNKERLNIMTGVPPSRTETVVGATIDNPFISTPDEAYRAGVRAAMEYSGMSPTLAGSVISVNRLGETGEVTMPVYAQVEADLKAAMGAAVTYAEVETYYTVTLGLETYDDIEDYLYEQVRNRFENQAYGNVAGARVYDKKSRQWYRIREANFGEESISFQAEYDTLHADWQKTYAGYTYGSLDTEFSGLTYQQAQWIGVNYG